MLAGIHRWIVEHDERWSFLAPYMLLAVTLAIFWGLFWLVVVVAVHLAFEIIKQHDVGVRRAVSPPEILVAEREMLGGAREGGSTALAVQPMTGEEVSAEAISSRNPSRPFMPLPVLTRSLWELKLDLGLVLCALALGVYLDVIFGIAGLRAGAQAARVVRGLLMSLDEAALVGSKLKEAVGTKLRPVLSSLALVAARVLPRAGKFPLNNPSAPETELQPSLTKQEDLDDRVELWGGWLSRRWNMGDRLSLAFLLLNLFLLVAAPLFTQLSGMEVIEGILAELHP